MFNTSIATTSPASKSPITMTSLELVELINHHREEGRAELRHDNFMAKIEKHPGIDSPKFLGQYKDITGRSLKCYYLPRRETELMIMAESAEVQTRVYDRMRELEEKTQPRPALTDISMAHFLVAEAMTKFGVNAQLAMAVALKSISIDTGITTEHYRLALPPVEDPATLNQTQVGEGLGLTSVAVGKQLRRLGLMIDDASGSRIVTEKGRQFGDMKAYQGDNGHTGYEPRWKPALIEFLKKELGL